MGLTERAAPLGAALAIAGAQPSKNCFPQRQASALRETRVGGGAIVDGAAGMAHRGQASRSAVRRVHCSDYRCESGAGIGRDGVMQPAEFLVGIAQACEAPVNEIDHSVTGLIHAWNAGDNAAGDRLFSLVYDELRTIARRLRYRAPARGDDTLDTTALVHEVYLRLAGANALNVQNRGHFFAVAVRASRQIVSNYARDAQTLKRGGNTVIETLDTVAGHRLVSAAANEAPGARASALEDALQELERLHPRPCRVVECRYFGGLSIPDTAIALGISEATVKRDWAVAQAWLHRALRDVGAMDGR